MKLNRILLFLFVAFNVAGGSSVAQISQWKFFIGFTDKNGSLYSTSNPSAFLSAKAIQRRANQNITYKTDDLPVNPQYIDSVVANGATVLNRTKWFNGVTISVPDTATFDKIMALPFVKDSIRVKRPGNISKGSKFEEITTQNFMRVSNVDVVQSYGYGISFNQIHLMNGEYLHNLGYHGEGMQIALIDAGFNSADVVRPLDSVFANNQILGTWDFVANETSVYEDDAHGEEVLSCIAGYVQDTLIGTAPKASFWLLRSEDAPTENIIEEYNWASAAEYADSAGADIISSSLGYTTFDNLRIDTSSTTITNPENHTYADMDGNHCPSSVAADVAASKGMLVLVAAGNQGAGGWHYISAPSDGDSVLSVGAVNFNGYHAGFSSYGPSSDGDVKPNVAAKGSSTIISLTNGTVASGSGTSFACPVLAGSAACLWQAHPSLANMDIFRAIEQSANYANNPNDSLGYGIPDFMLADQILTMTVGTQDVIVYPNPFSSNIKFLTSSFRGKITIEVFDELGRAVLNDEQITDGFHAVVLPQAVNLSKGIYFLRVTNGENAFVKRMVKM